jgi:TolB protein
MKAFKSILCLLFILSYSQFVFSQQAVIKVGDAKSRKSNLAFPFFNNIGTNESAEAIKASADIYNMAKSNLELSAYFEMMSPTAFLEDTKKLSVKPKAIDSNGFSFEPWKKIDTEFLVRTSYSLSGKDLTVETFLYQVDQSKLVVGKRYKAKINQSGQIGNTIANDILEAITGIRGSFMSRIVATTDKTGNKEVLTMALDGSDKTTITHDRSVAISPNWSPDGKKIIYSIYTKRRGSAQQNLTMFLHDLGTGKRNIISNRNGLNSGGSFSPDGKNIYLTISKGGSPDIYNITINGDQVSQLTKGPAGAMNVEAAVSPDGSKIAFSSDRGGSPMVYVMNVDGSNVKRLTFQGKYNSTPTWSRDGKQIAFAGQVENYFDIFLMDSDGKNISRITSATKSNGRRASHEDPSFSPDGRFVVYTSNRTGKNQIFIGSIDGTQERRVTNDSYNYFKPKWSANLE